MSRLNVLRNLYRERLSAGRRDEPSLPDNTRFVRAWTELNERGFAVIPGYFNNEQCADAVRSIERAIELSPLEELLAQVDSQPKHGRDQPGGYKAWVDKHNSDFRVIGAEVLSPLIRSYMDDGRIHDTGSAFMGFPIEPNFCMANRTRFVPANTGSGGGWHRDEVFRRGFKSLVYLVDVDTDNGPFQLIPRTQTWRFHLVDGTGAQQYQYTQEHVDKITHGDPDQIRTITAEAGTLLLFETNLIHRGKPIVSGTRYALTNYFKGA